MARSKQNGMLDFLTEKKETYRRSVKSGLGAMSREKRARLTEEKATHADIQKGYAYDQGKHDKQKGRKPDVRFDNIVLSKPVQLFGRDKAYSIAKAGYMAGYRQNPKKRNPVDSAAALAEAWHGLPASSETDYIERVRFHGVLTDLGQLVEIKVMVTARKAQAILFDEETRLCSSENGKQLYIVGGDQSLDLRALGIGEDEADKDLVTVGEAYSLTYITAKHHLGKADKVPGPYEHVLGEDGGERPMVVYDTLNEAVGFAGGSYKIDPTDYDGRHSAGIRN